MYAIGAEKGALLDAVLEDLRPRSALEVGSFLGYSAVRTARQLAPDGLLVCIGAQHWEGLGSVECGVKSGEWGMGQQSVAAAPREAASCTGLNACGAPRPMHRNPRCRVPAPALARGRAPRAEANPDNAAVARAVVDHAGLGGRVVILQGLGSERLADAARVVAEAAGPSGDQGPRQQADVRGGSSSSSSERVLATLRREAARQELAAAAAAAAAGGAGGGGPADTEALQQEQREQQQQQQQQQQQVVPGARVDYLFLDHCKPCYLPDLVAAEALGLVGPGTVVAADNVVYPGGWGSCGGGGAFLGAGKAGV